MKVALPVWHGRISPVFDVAGNLLVADVVDGAIREQYITPLQPAGPQERAKQMAKMAISVLVCGAVSRTFEAPLRSAGISVIAHHCGEAEQVLAAYVQGQLAQDVFAMPGCPGRRRRLRRQQRRRGTPSAGV